MTEASPGWKRARVACEPDVSPFLHAGPRLMHDALESYRQQHKYAMALVKCGVKPRVGSAYNTEGLTMSQKATIKHLAQKYTDHILHGLSTREALERHQRGALDAISYAEDDQVREQLMRASQDTNALLAELDMPPHGMLYDLVSERLNSNERKAARHKLRCKMAWVQRAHDTKAEVPQLQRAQSLESFAPVAYKAAWVKTV